MHNNLSFSTLVCLSLGGFIACQPTQQKQEQEESVSEKPNVIYIMADDLGYGDLGCYGQTSIKTPHINKMAAEGMMFTSFYSGSTVSAPSRYSLMTGKHMGHALVRGNSNAGGRPGDGIPVPDNVTTIAEVMKQAGYATGMFGKWGLGVENTSGSPEKQGWDKFLGYLNQVDAHKYHFNHLWQVNNNQLKKIEIDSNRYVHKYFIDSAMQFIQNHKDTNFFLYLPVTIPHSELVAPLEAYENYVDEQGKSIFEETPFEGGVPFEGAHYISPQDKPNATYAAMITLLDKDVGNILDLLKKLHLDNNTLVIFTSDNGADHSEGHQLDFFNSNANLRGRKRTLYEGGIRVPFIAWSPGIVPVDTINAPFAAWDIYPTLAELAGKKVDETKIDGISFVNQLKGTKQQHHDYMYWEYYVPWDKKFMQAVRKNKWKAIRWRVNDKKIHNELYDLSIDIGEQYNLAKEHPEIMQEMIEIMNVATEKPKVEEFPYAKEVFEQK